jgi:hypothetical protein
MQASYIRALCLSSLIPLASCGDSPVQSIPNTDVNASAEISTSGCDKSQLVKDGRGGWIRVYLIQGQLIPFASIGYGVATSPDAAAAAASAQAQQQASQACNTALANDTFCRDFMPYPDYCTQNCGIPAASGGPNPVVTGMFIGLDGELWYSATALAGRSLENCAYSKTEPPPTPLPPPSSPPPNPTPSPSIPPPSPPPTP